MHPTRTLIPLLVVVLGACALAIPAQAKPQDPQRLLNRVRYIDREIARPAPQVPAGVFNSAGHRDTVYFGGTYWNADSLRWEAIEDSVWTFDSGVGSHFNHSDPNVDPFKDPSLHASMEGWVGIDLTYNADKFFRRLSAGDFPPGQICVGSTAGLGGNYSFWAGALPQDNLCYVQEVGYGNSWDVCIEQTFATTQTGQPATLEFDFVNDTEPGFDFTHVYVDTTGGGGTDIQVAVFDGAVNGHASHTLSPGSTLPLVPGPVTIKFCVTSDAAYSDQDGLYLSNCGAFALDDVSLQGAGISHLADFEAGSDGWALSPIIPGPGGDWSDIAHVDDLDPVDTVCGPCDLQDSVLVLADPTGHGLFQENLAISPWIDLKKAGLVGSQGRVLEFDIATQNTLLFFVGVGMYFQYSPHPCGTSPLANDGSLYFINTSSSFCTREGEPSFRIDLSSFIPPETEKVRIGFAVNNLCRFFYNCATPAHPSPYFDNVRFGVYAEGNAPLLSVRDSDLPRDAFPTNPLLNITDPARIDSRALYGGGNPGSVAGDTLGVTAVTLEPAELRVQFAVNPGPGINALRLANWLATHPVEETRDGLTWYSARLDTAEQGGVPAPGEWMTAYHEDDPNFSGADTDLDTGDPTSTGGVFRLNNDIFPDDLLTPGSRLLLFYKGRYLAGSSWYSYPDTSGGTFLEMEVLPSSAVLGVGGEIEHNCLLFVNDAGPSEGDVLVEEALAQLFPGGSTNFENTAWDRWDSGSGGFARPDNGSYGATTAHIAGYRVILLEPIIGTVEDDLLSEWLTLGTTSPGLYWMYGFVQSGLALAELCGFNTGTAFTTSDNCFSVDPVAGGHVAAGAVRATAHGFARGGVCPGTVNVRRLNLSGTAPGNPLPDERLNSPTIGPVDYASIANHETVSYDYKTVVDAVPLRHRIEAATCAGTDPVLERLAEVLDFFGMNTQEFCSQPQTVGLSDEGGVSAGPRLARFAPNPLPARATGQVAFNLAEPGKVTVEIYDLSGRKLRHVLDADLPAGEHTASWDGTDEQGRAVSAGVYFYRLQIEGGESLARKMVVLGGGE